MNISRTITKDINSSKLQYEIALDATLSSSLITGIGVKGDEYTFNFTTSPDEGQLDLLIAQHDSMASSIDSMKEVYRTHTQAGIDYFETLRASVAVDILEETTTEADAFFIENKLDAVKSKVISGDWRTAQNEITNNVTVEGALTQELYDSIKGTIDAYVATNFN